jgi:SAM-dependent methyltransferase
MDNKSLDELFHHYGSDKANIFIKNNSKGHGYSDFYKDYLKEIKKNNINILEIGSFAGASAAAFVKYFPEAQVFCFDVNISKFEFSSKNIHVFGLDINKKNKVEQIIKNIFREHQINGFDLIIDDGSHNLSDILIGLNFLFKHLKNKGTFVIEDFKHPNYYKYNNNINHIFMDKFLNNLINKKFSNSSIFSHEEQSYLMNSIEKVNYYRGNLSDSDICFIRKK